MDKRVFSNNGLCVCGHVGAAHQREGNLYHKCKATVLRGTYTYPCNCESFNVGGEVYE